MRYWAFIVKNIWRIIVSVGVIFFVFLCCDYEDIADFFFDKNPYGELLKVILTSIGGIFVIYGLFLNNKRIKQQNRQNSITESSNSDKRYSDAVGYLGSDNSTSILGGVYTLYQLAKEDKRYRPIVANLLCSYLRENCDKLNEKYEENEKERAKIENDQGDIIRRDFSSPIIIQTIIDILFNNEDSTFDNEKLDLSNTHLKNIKFNGDIKNCNFNFSVLKDCVFIDDVFNNEFKLAQILNCYFYSRIYFCDFSFSSIRWCSFGISSATLSFIEDCQFCDIKIKRSYFYVDRIIDCTFDFLDFDDTSFNNTTFEKTTIKNDLDQIRYNNCTNRPIKLERSNL